MLIYLYASYDGPTSYSILDINSDIILNKVNEAWKIGHSDLILYGFEMHLYASYDGPTSYSIRDMDLDLKVSHTG